MMPFLLLALGLGAVLTAYELSPRTRTRVDDYARAIREAHAAHRAADAYLSDATVASVVAAQHARAVAALTASAPTPTPTPPAAVPTQPAPTQPAPTQPAPVPTQQALADAHASAGQGATDVGIDRAVASTEANQEAARKTTEALLAAKTDAERAAAAQSAAKVLEREKQLAAAYARLGASQCEVRIYPRVTAQVTSALIARLHSAGMAVTGNNPWNVDTHDHGVKLRAAWNSTQQALKIIVTAGAGGLLSGQPTSLVCPAVWKKIDPIMKELTS